MLQFLKKLFREEVKSEEVSLSGLSGWLEKEASTLELNNYLKEYFRQLQDLKKQLEEKVQILSCQAISEKEQKQVESRIQNIVLGHRDHYVREVEHFLNSLNGLNSILLPAEEHQSIKDNQKIEECQSREGKMEYIEHFRQAWEFNHQLNLRLSQLAQNTIKSYQATQHLFFDQVEPVFKTLAETNSLAKNFPGAQVENLLLLKELVSRLKEEKARKEELTHLIEKGEEKLAELRKRREESGKTLNELKESDSFAEYSRLLKEREKLKEQFRQVENEIYSFFSRLQKPLKKYERIALDNKPILPYLEDSLPAFWQDRYLRINEALQGLKKSLLNRELEFDQRQKDNFLSLIEKSEQGELQELRQKGEQLREEEERMVIRIESMAIINKLQRVEETMEKSAQEIAAMEKKILEWKSKIEKDCLRKIEEEFSGRASEIFSKKIVLIFS